METLSRTDRQKLCLRRWMANNCVGVCQACTGFGKTRIALMAIELLLRQKPDAQIIVSVPTEYLKNQWEEQLFALGYENNCQVIIINTIVKHTYVVDLLIVDEAHRSASQVLSEIFTAVKYSMLLCLTATLERLDGREEIIKERAPVFDTITLEEAEKNGWVSPVKNYLVLLNVDLTKYKEFDKKFNSYFAFFGFDFDIAMKCLQDWTFRNKFAKQIGSDPKTVLQMSAQWMKALHARKDFIENNPKKIEICRKIVDARQNTKGVMFCPTIKFAESIKRGNVLHSKQKATENKKAIEKFNKESTGWLATSHMLDEGSDVAGLTVGIQMSVDSSKIRSTQRRGRICRFAPGKTAEMFTLVINGTQEVRWFNNSKTGDYITIDSEENLNKVLNYEEIESRNRDYSENTKYRF